MSAQSPHNPHPSSVQSDKTLMKHSLNKEEEKLIKNLGLSEKEYRRYQQLSPSNQVKITEFLKERKRLNTSVNTHLSEKINREFAVIIAIFFPTDHNLRYALKKVDELEHEINRELEEESVPLFDKKTTKQNRLTLLLNTAESYHEVLSRQLEKLNPEKETDQHELLQQKKTDLERIITDMKLQIETTEFYIHDKTILDINDSELVTFLNKLKTIGITGFSRKEQASDQTAIFKVSFFSAIYRHFKEEEPSPDDDHRPNKRFRK